MKQSIGFIGLGKMGVNIVTHLQVQGIDVVAYNRTPKPESTVQTLPELVKKLIAPRVIFLMVPSKAVDEVIGQLTLNNGDTLIDGGNSFYKDSVRRSEELSKKGVHFVDCGTSGGLEGASTGACLMLGGDQEIVKNLSWLWDAMAIKNGWAYFGSAGAGHFVKMVHNGIEYGMDQAIGEGIEILAKAPYQLDLAKVADTWTKGSIVRSYLVELLARALQKDPILAGFTGHVGGGETGGWTLAAAREFGVDAPVIADALAARQRSLSTPSTSSKVVSALRKEYGGHEEVKGV